MKIFLISISILSYLFSQGFAGHVDDLEAQPVTIRIWNDAFHGGVDVGHVSIDTGARYISLWPSKDNRVGGNLHVGDNVGPGFIKHIAEKVSGGCVIAAQATGMSLMGDLFAEERAPEQVYQLKLNARAINDYWDRLCETADINVCNDILNIGEPLYARQIIKFNDLTWYVGGNPNKHRIAGKPSSYLEERLQKERNYSCASLGLHMLIVGDIACYGIIDDKTLFEVVPAAEQEWYRLILSKSNPDELLLVEPESFEESWLGDAAGRLVGRALRPLVEKITTSDYVTPWQVSELVQRCCVNQYYMSLTVPLQLEEKYFKILREYVLEILTSYYPEKKLLKRYYLKYKVLLESNLDSLNSDQQAALLSYFSARGRTIQDLKPLLNMKIAQVTAHDLEKNAQTDKFSTKKVMDDGKGDVCHIL